MPTSGTISQLTIPVLEDGTITNRTYDLPSGGGGGGGSDTNFVGTTAEWNALSLSQKAKYKTVDLTDDFMGVVIDLEPTPNSNNIAQSGGIVNYINRALTDVVPVSVSYKGTASSTGTRKQVITVDDVDNIVYGSIFMEQQVTLSPTSSTTATFTNAAITTNSSIDIYTEDGIWVQSVSTINGSCSITLPSFANGRTITVKIEIK